MMPERTDWLRSCSPSAEKAENPPSPVLIETGLPCFPEPLSLIHISGFCVTLILAAALGAFLCVDNTLSAAGFDGGGFARSALSLWDHTEQWVGAIGGTIKIGAERIRCV